MIRYSEPKDLKDIISLWNEAFGDNEQDIMIFINAHYKPENTLVYEENGVVVSMLFLLEGEMQINKRLYPSYYLYAACTLNRCRGRGYMSSLLDFAKETASNRKIDYICLLPAEASLYGYYEKFGYKAVFKNKVITFKRDEIASVANSESETVADKSSLRNKAYSSCNYFKWNKQSVEFAFRHNEYYGGNAILSCKGYMLYNLTNGSVTVKENTFTESFHSILSSLFAMHPFVNEIIVNLHYNFDCKTSEYKIVDHGMILAVNESADKALSEIDSAYLGLTLD